MNEFHQSYAKFNTELLKPGVRRMFREDPKSAYEQLRGKFPDFPDLREGVELKVVSNTADKIYVVLSEVNDSHVLETNQLSAVNAAGQGASTLATICSTASTASTVQI